PWEYSGEFDPLRTDSAKICVRRVLVCSRDRSSTECAFHFVTQGLKESRCGITCRGRIYQYATHIKIAGLSHLLVIDLENGNQKIRILGNLLGMREISIGR